MNLQDIGFVPHNDMTNDDTSIVTRHDRLIKWRKYGDATILLNAAGYNKGFRASLFNYIQARMQMLELYFLNEYLAHEDEIFSFSEPTAQQMEGKLFWIQLYE
ncbi:MAG: hypothetical protein OSJ69_14300 [Acetatifactor sp.]|nr:hypothetical protein [Acetatifactor sp.]